jgi:integrase
MGDGYIRELRRKALGVIETDDILAVLKPIWNAKRETARRMRQRLERVLDAAKVAGHRTGDNPSRWQGHLALLLPKQGRGQVAHHAALPWVDMPDFMDRLGQREGLAALALEYLILTAARSGEVRGAVWGEIDLAAHVWSIPAARMKAGRDHRVPLTGRALDVLAKVAALRPRAQSPADIVFPGLRRAPMSDMTLAAVLKRMAIDNATVHGFRSTFRDWASVNTSASFETLELALAHSIGDATVKAYARDDLIDKRRALMETWERYLYRVGADIVQIGGVA